MKAVPLTQRQANAFIEQHHRHHKKAQGDIFRFGAVSQAGELIAVATVGRPVARGLDDGQTVELTRLCTTGERNSCSFMYAKAARIAKELGFKRIVTYTLESETGASLRASGWKMAAITDGGSWSCRSRPRTDKAPICRKKRWERQLDETP